MKFRIADAVAHSADYVSHRFGVLLRIDNAAVGEIEAMYGKTLDAFNQDSPNAAKISGNLVFWIRKLKPISHSTKSRSYYAFVNEYAAIIAGVAILNIHTHKLTGKYIAIPTRELEDFAISLRYHSHSPHGLTLAFELFMAR